MKCQKCGYTLPEDSEFCQYCGTHLDLQSASDIIPDEAAAPEEVIAVAESADGVTRWSASCPTGTFP